MNTQYALAELERTLKHHPDADIKNYERLRSMPHPHTTAVCRVLTALLSAFDERKLLFIVEAEIAELGRMARPEDIVGWVEGVGIFVVEVKSHEIDGIRSFENNVPQVIYKGNQGADCDLLDQPKDFAYKFKGVLEKLFDDKELEPPPLYYAGWLPNVSLTDLLQKNAEVAQDKVWLSDMLERDIFLERFKNMKNITRGSNTDRSALELFSRVFSVTTGLRSNKSARPTMPGTMGNLLDRRSLALKRMTEEQEKLAFSPNLVRGPKVIRGVAGSGKTVVLANAVAETFLREYAEQTTLDLFNQEAEKIQILVLCYNRALVSYLRNLIHQCFDARRSKSEWAFPSRRLIVVNIDQYASNLAKKCEVHYSVEKVEQTVSSLLSKEFPERHRYTHIFIDEGQDLQLEWYPLIRELAKPSGEDGASIIVFYDEAQNLYDVRRPGTSKAAPPWKGLLGAVPNPRGLTTIMRVGHRNTNEILPFSFHLLLGAFSDHDPQMATFAEIAAYAKEQIPHDASIDHPNAGKHCVEKLGNRHYKVNFAVQSGSVPNVHCSESETQMLKELVKELKSLIDPSGHNVDPPDILVMAPTKSGVEKIVEKCRDEGLVIHCPVRLGSWKPGDVEPRDQPFFQKGKITVSTIKSAKGYTAHVCHVTFVHELAQPSDKRQAHQEARAQLHVGCTRATLFLDLWGIGCELMREAELAAAALR